MVASGSPATVWDPRGATEISANGLNTANPGNTEYALMSFNTSTVVSQLNTQYPGGWTITSVGVTLYSNFAQSGVYPNNSIFNEIEPGAFTLNYLSNNGWVSSSSGGVTWNNLNNYVPGTGNNNREESQGTFNYVANGTSPFTWTLSTTSDFVDAIAGGGTVSMIGTPADNQVGYLFDAPIQGNPAVLDITAQAVPEPGSGGVILASLGLIGALGRRRRTRPHQGILG